MEEVNKEDEAKVEEEVVKKKVMRCQTRGLEEDMKEE